jgi:hypothetical protein
MSEGYYQRPLIPLSDEELQDKSRLLGRRICELEEMKEHHNELRKDMADAERQLTNHIRALARVVRDGAEERD